MFFAKHYKKFLVLPVVLSIVSIIALGVWGLRPGIDLAGGSLLQVTFTDAQPTVSQVENAASQLQLGGVRVQQAGTGSFMIRTRALTPDEKTALEQSLGSLGSIHEDQATSIGPSIGAEILHKGYVAIALVSLCIIAFIAFAFRQVSEPVSSWKYGVIAIVTLVHDMLIPAGIFALLGHVSGAEVDSLFIVALLTILGISINDTIVVFDRIRENLRSMSGSRRTQNFAETIGVSINQTLARSINTSLTVIMVLLALFFVGPVATKYFALTLLAGMIAGTYSSIFLAAPLLVLWGKSRK
ncbi:MAG TPA: protein translocase subunit SecF [Candidatus Paceibacterota bacterium]